MMAAQAPMRKVEPDLAETFRRASRLGRVGFFGGVQRNCRAKRVPSHTLEFLGVAGARWIFRVLLCKTGESRGER